ncbi:MAG: HAD family phosphatase [Clostridia bacterium]|nr:HAD family phosphatase [Clostridia bacterium]
MTNAEYDVIALDVDGTLLNSKKQITPAVRESLLKAQNQGKKVIIASGRHQIGLRDISTTLQLDRFGGCLMAFNGGRIEDAATGEVFYSAHFPREFIKPVCDTVKNTNLTVVTFKDDLVIMNDAVNNHSFIESKILGLDYIQVDNFVKYVDFNINKLLLVGESSVLDEYQNVLRQEYEGCFDVFKSCPILLEVMPHGINKGTCMQIVLDHMGLSRDRLIACGDSYNDISMISYAGLGVCMGNGEEDVKQIADVIADTNNNDGIAKIVHKYMLHGR